MSCILKGPQLSLLEMVNFVLRHVLYHVYPWSKSDKIICMSLSFVSEDVLVEVENTSVEVDVDLQLQDFSEVVTKTVNDEIGVIAGKF